MSFYAAFVIKNYNFDNKMEMKENIYPRLPTAPPIEDQGQGYRLQKINEIQAFLEKEVATREALSDTSINEYFEYSPIVGANLNNSGGDIRISIETQDIFN